MADVVAIRAATIKAVVAAATTRVATAVATDMVAVVRLYTFVVDLCTEKSVKL